MAFFLTNRAKLRQDFYALTGTSATDDSLEEYDSEADERVHRALHFGLWRAQRWMIDKGYADGWRASVSKASADFTTETDGRRWCALPSNFLRLAGDEHKSALFDGQYRWGRLEPREELLRDYRGDRYAIRGLGDHNPVLWLAREASLPASLTVEYHFRHATLDDDTDALDFPPDCTDLIPAYAAEWASTQAWLPGGDAMRGAIQQALSIAQRNALSVVRRDRGPKVLHARPAFNNRWM